MIDEIRQCPVCEGWFAINPNIRGRRRNEVRYCSCQCASRERSRERREARWRNAEVGTIPLGNGIVALVDVEDWDSAKNHTWSPRERSDGGPPYAVAKINGKNIYLHRWIMGDPNAEVDHINMDRLDCRKNNLRLATRMEQSANTTIRTTNSSGYKGVSWHKFAKKWRATIQRETIGYFLDKIEAAIAYDHEARKRFGEFARVNFPQSEERGCFDAG